LRLGKTSKIPTLAEKRKGGPPARGSGGIYWFPERFYPSSQGRFLSPDPAGMGSVDLRNPQSWNRYAYVVNNPLAAVDPTGLFCNAVVRNLTGGGCDLSATFYGGGWNEFDVLQMAFTPTSYTQQGWVLQLLAGDPTKFTPWSDGSYYLDEIPNMVPVYGNIGLLSVIFGGGQAANNSTATIGPPPQPKPGPTGLKKYLTQYVPCAVGEGINQFWGDDDTAAATVLANIAPLAPANLLKGGPFVYLAITAAYDFSKAFQVRQTCTQSVYGGG
jgi:RHS repeat-associated protein